jgi:hypothetical protein
MIVEVADIAVDSMVLNVGVDVSSDIAVSTELFFDFFACPGGSCLDARAGVGVGAGEGDGADLSRRTIGAARSEKELSLRSPSQETAARPEVEKTEMRSNVRWNWRRIFDQSFRGIYDG